jgi:hypothetical protein
MAKLVLSQLSFTAGWQILLLGFVIGLLFYSLQWIVLESLGSLSDFSWILWGRILGVSSMEALLSLLLLRPFLQRVSVS